MKQFIKFQFPSFKFQGKGFTLLELLIVLGITTIITGIGVSFYVNQQKTKLLDLTAQEILGYLRYAQQKSIAQEEGEQWGVHFENLENDQGFYALFKGSVYGASKEKHNLVKENKYNILNIFSPYWAFARVVTEKERIYLPSGIKYQLPGQGESVDVLFDPLTGFLSESSYEQVIIEDISGKTVNILACKQGLMGINQDIEICGDIDTTPPEIREIIVSDSVFNNYVSNSFKLSASVYEEQGGLESCEYTINGGSSWLPATKSGTGPLYSCVKTGITVADGTSLALNIRATSEGGTGTGNAINKVVDAVSPNCSDNWTDNWTNASPVNVSISCSDAKSGVASNKYCIDTNNNCTPNISYITPVSIACNQGQTCAQYIRYQSKDNVNNFSSIYSKKVRQDRQNPIASDNWVDNWTNVSPVNITINSSDENGSGVKSTQYCVDTSNTCNPTINGANVSISCNLNTNCIQYVRYKITDNVNNISDVNSKRIRQDRQGPLDGVLTVTAGPYKNTLSWGNASDSGSGLATTNTYKVVYSISGNPGENCSSGTQIYLGTDTSYVHSGLTGGTLYYYRVCAYDIMGNVSVGALKSSTPSTTTTTTITKKNNGSTCSSGSECKSGYCYVDNDGDRYAPSSGTKKCQASSQLSGTDCCDSDSRAYPGAGSYYFTTNNCGSWDYNCDGVAQLVYSASGYCACSILLPVTVYRDSQCKQGFTIGTSCSLKQPCECTSCGESVNLAGCSAASNYYGNTVEKPCYFISGGSRYYCSGHQYTCGCR